MAPWGYDLDGGEVRWTKQLNRQIGYDPADVTPSLSAFRERVHPDDRVRLEEARVKESTAAPGTQFQVELRLVRPDGSLSWIEPRSRVIEHEGRRRIVGANVDITARKKQEDELHFIMGELSHRTKNLLSVVQAMASQTARYSGNFADFQERFLGRIRALSQSHDLLVSQNWTGAPLLDLILAQLMPFVEDEGRVQAEGPAIFLRAEAAQSLGIILHELATHASKYGALSVPAGNQHPLGPRPVGDPAELARARRPGREVAGPSGLRPHRDRAHGERHVRLDRQARAASDRRALERLDFPGADRQAARLLGRGLIGPGRKTARRPIQQYASTASLMTFRAMCRDIPPRTRRPIPAIATASSVRMTRRLRSIA